MALLRSLSRRFSSSKKENRKSVNGSKLENGDKSAPPPAKSATYTNGTSGASAVNGDAPNGTDPVSSLPSTVSYNGDSGSKPGMSSRKGSTALGKIPEKESHANGQAVSSDDDDDDSRDHPAATRQDVESVFEQFGNLISKARAPLPTQTGNGTYVQKKEKASLWKELTSLGLKDINTVKNIMAEKASGELQDDRKMLMEDVMQLVAALPTDSQHRVDLTETFLKELWDSLEHPPQSYLGDNFKYRTADGSNNNYTLPDLGKAGTPYARSVRPECPQPGALPDPGLIFDSIMAREEFKRHPNNVSSIFFNWASLVIHDLFQTDHRDYSISNTSSYLDLSILYGDTQEDQDLMRTFKDGKIKPDCFAEERLLMFPPACGVMLIMLNRFHNYVVEQLALINEGGRFNKPRQGLSEEATTAAWKKYDNDLFQTGRLVTCGMYINITLYDYLRTIVNLNRTNSTWVLDPRLDPLKKPGQPGTPKGQGNQVSCEFSLSYRWHSCIGQMDEQWTEKAYMQLFGKQSHEVSHKDLMIGLGKMDKEMPKDPHQRPFAGLKRDANGKFDDGALAKIFQDGVEEVAGSFGARNIPKSLRAITILGIEQARAWNCGSLNEFRKFFGLKTYDTFEEINPDPYVAEQLKHLYEHPDFVELYPGIATEAYKKPMVPGVGIAPTHTISRAVLSDAVALVRGDRFYTVDWNPKNLTNWGFNEVAYDLSVNQGCVFYKLLLHALPNHFATDSIYAHYPMTIPSENEKIMKSLGRYKEYSYDKPSFITPRVNLTSFSSAKYMLEHAQDFKVMWNDGLYKVIGKGGVDFCLGGDTAFHRQQKETMAKLLYKEHWHAAVKQFYQEKTLELIKDNMCVIAGINQVDITRDVGNLAHVHFASNVYSLPLKTEENPHGIFTDHELWMVMSVIFTAIFFDFEPTKSFPLKKLANKLSNMLGKLIELQIKSVTSTSFASKFFDSRRENENALKDYGVHMIRKLSESGMSVYDMVYSQILPTSTAMVPNQSQVITQIIDFYLGEGIKHLPEIQRLAQTDTPETDDKLLHYAMEGIRLNGTFGSYRRSEVNHTFHDDRGPVTVKPGDKVFCSFVSAARDPTIYPDPNEVKVDRPIESYIHYGLGDHTCLGKEASMVALTAMLRTIGRLEGLRRAPGPQGQLKKVPRPGGFYVYMREMHDSYFVFPTTLKVHFDSLPASAGGEQAPTKSRTNSWFLQNGKK